MVAQYGHRLIGTVVQELLSNSIPLKSHALGVSLTFLPLVSRSHAQRVHSHACSKCRHFQLIVGVANDNRFGMRLSQNFYMQLTSGKNKESFKDHKDDENIHI